MSSRAVALTLVVLLAPPALHAGPEFRVTFEPAVSARPFTGRVYVLLSKTAGKPLPAGPNWFNPEPFFAADVVNWKPGEPCRLTADALGHPYRLDELPAGTYYARAVLDFDRGERSFVTADGNGYGDEVRVVVRPGGNYSADLVIDQVYKAKPPAETARVKLVELRSRLLADFHGRPVTMRAAVVLPESYGEDEARRYPVLYVIPGFGGTHLGAFQAVSRNPTDVGGVEMLYVVLDPSCRWGHHVFADSDNNGPVGRALVEELIPHIEGRFRALGRPTARFLTGHSSGGWSSLWLQVTYPDFFGGTWSTAPDPVDFRDFQRVNLYEPGINLFTDRAGKPRPLARKGGKVVLEYQPFSDMEAVMGHGGQLGSFEAVFSPAGGDGRPRRLWDRRTGAVDPAVAAAWRRYDIRGILEENWAALAPKLRGKLHVYMGDRDTFYLEGATVLLKQSLARLGSDAVVELFPGRDHGNLLTADLRARIAREMATQFRRQAPYQIP